MNIAAVSFYMANINPDVVKYQKRVMDRLCPDVPFYQEFTQLGHGRTMELFLFQRTHDVIVFLDIDAIPLTEDAIPRLAQLAYDNNTIAGAPQRSNHIENDKHIFVGPCVLAIQPDLYRELKCPPARETTRGDVAEEWTYALEASGREPMYLKVLDYKKDSIVWPGINDEPYGLDTKYGFEKQMFHHSYFGRDPRQQESFITLCKALI